MVFTNPTTCFNHLWVRHLIQHFHEALQWSGRVWWIVLSFCNFSINFLKWNTYDTCNDTIDASFSVGKILWNENYDGERIRKIILLIFIPILLPTVDSTVLYSVSEKTYDT